MYFKRIAAFIFFSLIISIIGVYILIPSIIIVVIAHKTNSNSAGSCRTIDKWPQVFSANTDSTFSVNKDHFSITNKFSNGANILISNKSGLYFTKLLINSISVDSSILYWTSSITTGVNPVTRLISYFRMMDLKKTMQKAAVQLETFLKDDKNIYGYNIVRTTLTDTYLVSIKWNSSHYPEVKEIYKRVERLQNYIKQQKATQSNSPMVNISSIYGSYTIMVAIPTNKLLPAFEDVLPKRLSPMKDKILTAQVTGGTLTIENAYKSIEMYMQDHSLASPVIPFEYMTTDRNKESDTSKWVTLVYYPVI